MKAPQSLGAPEFEVDEMQKLWFATRKQAWHSLVIVPATPGFSVAPLAEALAHAGESCLEQKVHFMSAEGADFPSALRRVEEMRNQASAGHCVVIAVDCVLQNMACMPLLLAADACLLGVQLGQSRFAQLSRSMERMEAAHFIGVVTVP